MNGFERLGLGSDADERAVKRAYARELKRCRPEDDPEGFQALNEAYRWALQQARSQDIDPDEACGETSRMQVASEAETTTQIEPDGTRRSATSPNRATHRIHLAYPPVPAACVAVEPAFDTHRFLAELHDRACAQPPAQLNQWLGSQEALYALDLKQALRLPVTQTLALLRPAPPAEAVDAVLKFFALDRIDGEDPLLDENLLQLHQRMAASEHFRRTLQALQSDPTRATDRLLVRELIGPRRLWRRALIALTPTWAPRLSAILDALERIDRDQAQSQFDAESLAFWRRETDLRRISPLRMAVVALRLAALGALMRALAPIKLGDIDEPILHALAIAFVAWLGWSVGQAACLRWAPPALASRMDRPTALLALVLAGAACLTPSHPVVASVIAFFAVAILSSFGDREQRGDGMWTSNLLIMTSLAVCGFALFRSAAYTPLAIAGAGALLLLHDLGHALSKGISLAAVRQTQGCYAPLTASVVVLSLATVFAVLFS